MTPGADRGTGPGAGRGTGSGADRGTGPGAGRGTGPGAGRGTGLAVGRAMDGDGYVGAARLEVGASVLDVQADLRGQFEPIDGRYHWYGRLARHDGLTAAMAGQARAAAVLSTPHGSAQCEVSDLDPWQRYRVSGISTPPFRSELARQGGALAEPSAGPAGGER